MLRARLQPAYGTELGSGVGWGGEVGGLAARIGGSADRLRGAGDL